MNEYYLFNSFNGVKLYFIKNNNEIISDKYDYISGTIVQIIKNYNSRYSTNNGYIVGKQYNWSNRYCTLIIDEKLINSLDKVTIFG